MPNIITIVKFNYRLGIDKALGNFRKSDSKYKNNVRRAWDHPVTGSVGQAGTCC